MNKFAALVLVFIAFKAYATCPAMPKLIHKQPFELYAKHGDGLPRDEANFIFCGVGELELLKEFQKLGFFVSQTPSMLKLIRETADIFLNRSYPTAPMSHLMLFNRSEDYGVEEATKVSPRQRHHARMWKAPADVYGEDVIFMAASFDENISIRGFTHVVSPLLDEERLFFSTRLEQSALLKFTGKLRNSTDLDKSELAFKTDGYAFVFERKQTD